MAPTEFWQRMRELRTALVEAGEADWSNTLGVSLAPTARRTVVPTELVDDLHLLRSSEVAARLHLVATVEALLTMVEESPAGPG